jgi:hypothetical protein
MLVKKNTIVANPSKIDVKQIEHDKAKSLCYVTAFLWSAWEPVTIGLHRKF